MKITMNNAVIQAAMVATITESGLMFRHVQDDTVVVLPFLVDEVWLRMVCTGWERLAMGKPGTRVNLAGVWTPAMFGRAVAILVAESFGAGELATCTEWMQRMRGLLFAVGPTGYKEHATVTPDILRRFLRRSAKTPVNQRQIVEVP